MKKYEQLTVHLRDQTSSCVAMTFLEIEHVLGVRLPRSADAHRAWWSNNPSNNVMTRAWLDAGFESEQVDLTLRKLVFRRVTSKEPPPASPAPSRPNASDGLPKRPLFGWLKGTVSVAPGVDLTAPADPDWERRINAE